MGESKKEAGLRKLLDRILLRRALIKEYEKATAALVAQLQTGLEQEGFQSLQGSQGGNANFSSSSSIKMPATPTEVVKEFDGRTMAALLAGTKVNKEKQLFLERAWEGRDFSKVFSTERSQRFTVNLPKDKMQLEMMQKAIRADEEELNKKVEDLLEAYQGAEKEKALPDNPKADVAWKEGKKSKKKKAVKKPVPTKKAAKKKKTSKNNKK